MMSLRMLGCIVALYVSGMVLGQKPGQEPPPESHLRYRRIYLYNNGVRPPIIAGNNPRVRLQTLPRFDWEFALPALVPRQPGYPHDPNQTLYQLWVPRTYRHAQPHPLLLCVSARSVPEDLIAWDPVIRKYGALFATFYGGGDECPPARRMRLALEVFDDIRRRMTIDGDRVYVVGASEGARTACDLAFSYPEFVGGVVALGGGASPRPEPWMRDRARERLSVAFLTGEDEPGRQEVEKWRAPVLRDLEIRSQVRAVPRLGGTLPPPAVLEEAFVWLELGLNARRTMGSSRVAGRMADGTVPQGEMWAQGVVEEASRRLSNPRERESGLMQLEGVARRWKGGPAARRAERMLEEQNGRNKVRWQTVYDGRQQDYFYKEAKHMEDYLAAPRSTQDLLRRPVLMREMVGLWESVERHGPNTAAGGEATSRLKDLRKLLPMR